MTGGESYHRVGVYISVEAFLLQSETDWLQRLIKNGDLSHLMIIIETVDLLDNPMFLNNDLARQLTDCHH